MADPPSMAEPMPPDPNVLAADCDWMPSPVNDDDSTMLSDLLLFDGDLDFNFDFDLDLGLPPDAPYLLDDPSFSAPQIRPSSSDSDAGGLVEPCRILNSPSAVDRSSDVSKFLSQEASQETDLAGLLACPSSESEALDRQASGPASSQGSGNNSAANYYPSPDSENSARSAASSPNYANSMNGVVDQKIKLEEEGNNCLMKRKKHTNEDANSESRTSKYQRANAEDNPKNPTYSSPREMTATGDGENKRKARLMRNRESAQLSRQRKKQYVEELEDKVRSMHSTIQDLNSKISYIMAENATLRQQFSGGAMCPAPVPPPGAMYHPHPAMPYPWMPCPPYVVKPQGSQVPLVPIPKLKPQQPSSAPKSKKFEGKKKESKTKKVASVSFLGLLLFILLFGGLVPVVNVKFGAMQDGGSGWFGNRFYEHQYRGRIFNVKGHLNTSEHSLGMGFSDGRFATGNNYASRIDCGRDNCRGSELKAGEKEGSQPFPASNKFVQPGNSSEPLVASLYVPRNDKLVKIDGNLIIHSVLACEKSMASCRKTDETTSSKETGLAVAGNRPPAIPLTGRNNGRYPQYRNPSEQKRALGSGSMDKDKLKSTTADGELQQWFREGLAGPMLSSGMCTEVFQFDVSPTPGAIIPATSVMNVSADNRPNATHLAKGRNRRIRPGAAIPLAGSQNNITKEHVGRTTKEENFHGNNSLSQMVVSVLVDPREIGDVDSDSVMGPKSLPRIFVVVLIDSIKYVTYSCMLPLKGSGVLVTT
ncbi:bZIP transcription factor 17-like [Diospyros lotus]|uniref:bZIP transcription factor 17-like n=1 Tax=Diospyros lotus TaxID=55363 RepID=UPI00225A1B2F|nr:bZIP transcription factor 17-like [Diospyros lotus]